uniref:Serpentine receptor class gamma n=1 Tax=Meloidogyne incognita TaxID=6306 RepID=A0A914MT40_MELIC
MELLLFKHDEFNKIYNCTGINVDDVPIEKRRYPIAAITLYFPCLYSFWKNRSKNPCYILLIYLSLINIFTLWGPTFAQGIFSLNGIVYCSSPILTYFVGCLYLFLWAAECAADLVLGINRCIEMAFPNIAEILFYGKRIYIWIFVCNLYGFYWLYFRHPYIFNGIAFAVLFEPLIGYIPFRAEIFKQDLFENSLNNALLAVVTPIIYVLFIICFFFKTREVSDRVTKEEKMVFIQVFIVSMINTSTGIIYAYNLKNPDSGFVLVLVAHFCWVHVHGEFILLINNKFEI